MNLLLDTHVALWAIADSLHLTEPARNLIQSPDNQVWVSAVSVWEIAIKHSLGRGDMPLSGKQAWVYFREAGYGFLPVMPDHAAAVDDLPSHHHDPFDRLLIAQALQEPMHLLSRDAQVLKYSRTFVSV